jgi:hypothetical protein
MHTPPATHTGPLGQLWGPFSCCSYLSCTRRRRLLVCLLWLHLHKGLLSCLAPDGALHRYFVSVGCCACRLFNLLSLAPAACGCLASCASEQIQLQVLLHRLLQTAGSAHSRAVWCCCGSTQACLRSNCACMSVVCVRQACLCCCAQHCAPCRRRNRRKLLVC